VLSSEVEVAEGRYDEFAKIGQVNANYSTGYLFQAIAPVLAGRAKEAQAVLGRALTLEPTIQVRVFALHFWTVS
jgi:hypothetical protein